MRVERETRSRGRKSRSRRESDGQAEKEGAKEIIVRLKYLQKVCVLCAASV